MLLVILIDGEALSEIVLLTELATLLETEILRLTESDLEILTVLVTEDVRVGVRDEEGGIPMVPAKL